MAWLIDFILHIDTHLVEMINTFGVGTYFLLFLVIFIETGLVVFPFLPGDSLLFAAGALTVAHGSSLNIFVVILTFIAAAILGDLMNYHIGKKIGTKIPEKGMISKVINQEKLDKAEAFFNKHGGKTIFIARFMPFIRTFAPFVAGGSRMNEGAFLKYNVTGGIVWVLLCTLFGYFFGNIPIVKDNFSLVAIGVIFVSLIPIMVGFIRSRMLKKA